ncbi:asparagine synthase-related protein [Clostridium cagae]|uniref:asparagine synthase-related protein n=1 Tax=Clostridium cagae TaxID=2080751 RepID=UPI003F761B51
MCTIMCYTGTDMKHEKFAEALQRTESRGPDMTEILTLPSGILGFQRLAIMDLSFGGMQPFTRKKDASICNGEIYGFRKLKEELMAKGHKFISDSDCEILLPMYLEYGLDMFAKLDAEYAAVIYDGEKDTFIAARDPIGIRPLFYGYSECGKIMFASEAKNLVGLTEKIMSFPPGHYYADGKFTCYCDIASVEGDYCKDDLDVICSNIHDKLVTAIGKRMDADASVGFLLSGGLDSSLVCSIAQKMYPNKPIKTFAIGMTEDAIDLKYAKEVADYIHSDHTVVYMTKEEVLESLEEVIKLLGTFDITTIRASIGMYLICKKIHEISDVRVPFGDLDFVKYVMSIDPEKKLNKYNMGKYLLRHSFEGDYLPHNILYREKAAFSDAVGHSMVDYLKEYAETVYNGKDFDKISEKYNYHAQPFTKESLLYREIFEKYYPGQAEMIVDFWMPNKEWEGCAVDDPSARALSNYGDSGL